MRTVTWDEVSRRVDELIERQSVRRGLVYGVPTGGAIVAAMVAERTKAQLLDTLDGVLVRDVLIVDDLVDSGATLRPYKEAGYAVDALFRKLVSPEELALGAMPVEGWIEFPWEHKGGPTDAVTRLLQYIGEDPTRDGLQDTPARVVKAFKEMTVGYTQSPAEILSTTFDIQSDELVLLKDIRFSSLCEHHMLPFVGHAHVGYVPGEKVVGLSKLARLVQCFAKRLQVQERLTYQIADAVMTELQPKGAAVIVEAAHECMGCRGVTQPDARMVTSAMLGLFRENPAARGEFLSLCSKG